MIDEYYQRPARLALPGGFLDRSSAFPSFLDSLVRQA